MCVVDNLARLLDRRKSVVMVGWKDQEKSCRIVDCQIRAGYINSESFRILATQRKRRPIVQRSGGGSTMIFAD